MRFKLDENIGNRAAERLRAAGHEVVTVAEQSLAGADDRALIAAVQREKRCLVTFVLDFGNPIVFDLAEYSGIVVIRLSKPAAVAEIEVCIDTLIRGARLGPLDGKLWIVDRGMIREYQPPN